LCPARQSIGSHVDGAFARRLIVPELNLHAVPDGLSDQAASLAEPLACVCQCLLDPSAVSPGDRVGVVGPGPMGLLAAQLARALGGEVEIYGLPSDDERLSMASALGFAAMVGPGGAEPPCDVAVDASGSANGMTRCLELLRRGGRFVQIGIAGKPVTVPLDLLLRHELEVSTGFASTPRSWRRALRAISRGDVELEPLVTEVAPLADWKRVFSNLRSGRGMKIVLDPRRSTMAAIGSDSSNGEAAEAHRA
jgi:L-iditol 2-dehydrogenase